MRFRFPRCWLCGLAFVLNLAGPPVVSGQVFDPAADFSATNNPNGVWRYGRTNTLGSSFLADTSQQDPSGLSFWVGGVTTGSPPGSFPYVAHNGTNSTITYLGYLPYPPRRLGMPPGPGGQYSVIRFTPLQALLIDIEGSYFKIDPAATTD